MADRNIQGETDRKMAARRDAALITVISIAAAIICVKLDLSEALLGWTRLHERLQLDELPALLLVVACCLVWFSARRYGEARDQLVMRMKRADWDAVLQTNLTSAYLCIQQVIGSMLKQRWGRIINITSIFGQMGQAGQANYAASKAGLIHLTRSMALELAKDGILVNSVSPGPTATQYNLDNWAADSRSQDDLIGGIPLGRPGKPEEIAEAIAFLATSEGGFIQGHDLVVDGGYVIH